MKKKVQLPVGTEILVIGGYTGDKLHSARVGSSSLGCGHWTKSSVTNFMFAGDCKDSTLEKFSKTHEMCSKCFPQFAGQENPQTEAEQKKERIEEYGFRSPASASKRTEELKAEGWTVRYIRASRKITATRTS